MTSSEWVWHGAAGHNSESDKCKFHLCTDIGQYRISTVGRYHPEGVGRSSPMKATANGCPYGYTTYVFKIGASPWEEHLDSDKVELDGATDEKAERMHMQMCEKWAGL